MLTEGSQVEVELWSQSVRPAALLKACYWFSRNFSCELEQDKDPIRVVLTVKRELQQNYDDVVREFREQAMDFELREQVTEQTSEVRDLLLAKAFAESGVLEDPPSGVFGDTIEEENPQGLFKILQSS